MALFKRNNTITTPTIQLNDGNGMPVFGLGTWCLLKGSECETTVTSALGLGYRLIDTAAFYENHESVAMALQSVERESIFLTSKVWIDEMGRERIIAACDKTLRELKTDYLDLYLIHWPTSRELLHETIEGLTKLKEAKKIKSLGVSNCTINHLKNLIKAGFQISVNQVEYHPYLNQQELLDFCKDNNIVLTAYCPLARGAVNKDYIINNIAHDHGKTAVQVTFRWLLQKGMVIIPKTVSRERLIENIEIFDFELNDEEMQLIDCLNKNFRLVDPDYSDFNY